MGSRTGIGEIVVSDPLERRRALALELGATLAVEAADVGAFGQSLMLACDALGFGSSPQTSLGMMANTIKRVLGVGDEVKLLYGLAIGYPDEGDRRRGQQESLPLEQSSRATNSNGPGHRESEEFSVAVTGGTVLEAVHHYGDAGSIR